jgi:hypothetical protein
LLPQKSNKYCIFWLCVCSFSYPACNVYVPYLLISVSSLAQSYFSTVSHKGHDFGRKLLNTKYVFWFSVQLLSKTFLILRRIEQDIIIICIGHNIKYQLFLSDFNQTWIFLTDFQKILKYQILWKSIHWELSCSMWTDGQTDMTKLRVTFHNFFYVLKVVTWLLYNTFFGV